jgi:histidinol phosphatase-like enzyme
MNSSSAFFLDRDGVINVDRGKHGFANHLPRDEVLAVGSSYRRIAAADHSLVRQVSQRSNLQCNQGIGRAKPNDQGINAVQFDFR